MPFCFIIPAYQAGPELIIFLKNLLAETAHKIFVIDDGSDANTIFSDVIFQDPKIKLLRHTVNLGKGAALKYAFNEICVNHPERQGGITLDADGQHTIKDALNVLKELEKTKSLVLGVRDFSFKSKKIPLKSRIGNIITKILWHFFITGQRISDTQTGLRGIPTFLMKDFLSIEANRYEFEMEVCY